MSQIVTSLQETSRAAACCGSMRDFVETELALSPMARFRLAETQQAASLQNSTLSIGGGSISHFVISLKETPV
jgi:hypothetical protein